MSDETKVMAQSTAPGTSDTAAEKAAAKAERMKAYEERNHPAITAETKLKEVPEDFNFKKHNPIKRKNFEREEFYFDYKVLECDYHRDMYLKRAEEARTLGSTTDRAKAKRLRSMQEKMAELRQQLESQGIDVDKLLDS